jgi:hypothetical protein
MIDLRGLNTSMVDNYCINQNGKHQYKVVKFSQSINNFIQAELW